MLDGYAMLEVFLDVLDGLRHQIVAKGQRVRRLPAYDAGGGNQER